MPLAAMLAILALPVTGICGQPHDTGSRSAMGHAVQPYRYSSCSHRRCDKPTPTVWNGFALQYPDIPRDEELDIADPHQRIVQRIRADMLVVDNVSWRNGKTALRVVAHNGANSDSCVWTYLFTTTGSHVRNVLKFHGVLDDVRMDTSGKQVVAISSSIVPLEYFTDFCSVCCGNVSEVVAWRHGEPYLANRQYAAIARDEAADQWDKLTAAAKEDVAPPPLHNAEMEHGEVVAHAIGYYANEWTIGEGPAAKRRLKRTLGAADWRWFLRCQPELRRRLRTMVSEVTTDRRRVIRVPDAFPNDD